jgi:hypothetical protein
MASRRGIKEESDRFHVSGHSHFDATVGDKGRKLSKTKDREFKFVAGRPAKRRRATERSGGEGNSE